MRVSITILQTLVAVYVLIELQHMEQPASLISALMSGRQRSRMLGHHLPDHDSLQKHADAFNKRKTGGSDLCQAP